MKTFLLLKILGIPVIASVIYGGYVAVSYDEVIELRSGNIIKPEWTKRTRLSEDVTNLFRRGMDVGSYPDFSSFKSEIKTQKSNVKANTDCVTDKTQIPYSISDEELKKCITGLPENKQGDSKYYWIDIVKNNDLGEIDITAYVRGLHYDDTSKAIKTHTAKLVGTKLTGFNTFSTHQIVRERTIGIFLNTTWFKDNYSNNYSNKFIRDITGITAAKPEEVAYKFSGTGFVLNKEPNKPKYLIATNKHVLTHYEDNMPELSHNLKKIGQTDKGYPVYTNILNYMMDKRSNLNNIIGIAEDPDYTTDTDNLLQLKNYSYNIVKEIKVHKDYTNQFIKEHPYKNEYIQASNADFSSLESIFYNGKEQKITMDMVVLSVEFVSEKDDVFNKWWSKRPTQYRSMQYEDLFGDFLYSRDAWGPEFKKKLEEYKAQRDSTVGHTNSFESLYQSFQQYLETFKTILLESAVAKNTLVLDAKKEDDVENIHLKRKAYQSYYNDNNNLCTIERNKKSPEYKISPALISASPFLRDNVNINKHGQYSVNSLLFFQYAWQQPMSGSSGSAVFDQNLKIIGIAWGGTMDDKSAGCSESRLKVNIFTWFSFQDDLKILETAVVKSKNTTDQKDDEILLLKPYKYI